VGGGCARFVAAQADRPGIRRSAGDTFGHSGPSRCLPPQRKPLSGQKFPRGKNPARAQSPAARVRLRRCLAITIDLVITAAGGHDAGFRLPAGKSRQGNRTNAKYESHHVSVKAAC
jgi:hypothetical protein